MSEHGTERQDTTPAREREYHGRTTLRVVVPYVSGRVERIPCSDEAEAARCLKAWQAQRPNAHVEQRRPDGTWERRP